MNNLTKIKTLNVNVISVFLVIVGLLIVSLGLHDANMVILGGCQLILGLTLIIKE